MNWEKLLIGTRFGLEKYADTKIQNRTDFQRDFDRLIFSSPFRRLQNKTQVFPLPSRIFVHNRLTHSIEVSSVGRSLGELVGKRLQSKYNNSNLFDSLGTIVSASCLAHDLGNPPFGHSGETAISSYFREGEGQTLKSSILEEEGRWDDFINFDGNANSLRLLIHQFNGRRKGGFVLTYPTIASIVKYPYSSEKSEIKNKFGFFMTEEDDYKVIADSMELICKNNSPKEYVRHPLVFLVEAADDICYKVMDIEDAFKLNILSWDEITSVFLNFFDEDRKKQIEIVMTKVEDTNEQISYLRSSVIGLLIDECVSVFIEEEENILSGVFQSPLIKHISPNACSAYEEATKISYKKIYHSKEVIDIELAGDSILSFLLQRFTEAVLNPNKHYSKLLLSRIPLQYEVYSNSQYVRILAVIDFISGMTDIYALELYQKITGMSLPNV